jgi:hypothetical protein
MDDETEAAYHKKISSTPERKIDSKYIAYHTALISLDKLIKMEAQIT